MPGSKNNPGTGYPVDFNFEESYAVVGPIDYSVFNKSLLVRAQDFDVSQLVALNYYDFVRFAPAKSSYSHVHFLFHLPFSGSTLFSRFIEDSVFILRDPTCLYALFNSMKINNGFDNELLRIATMKYIAKAFESRPLIIRVAGSFPEMIEPLLDLGQHQSSAFLYSSPETFAAQVLKNKNRRIDVRMLMMKNRNEYVFAKTGKSIAQLSDGELVGILWFYTAEVVVKQSSLNGSIVCINGEKVIRNPETYARKFLSKLGIEYINITDPDSLKNSHAKNGGQFNYDAAISEIKSAKRVYLNEISAAVSIINELDCNTKYQSKLRAMEI